MKDYTISLECDSVYQSFGDNHVLHDVNLKVASGQIVSLVGPSGCGKSTLLRAKLGTYPPMKGAVRVKGKEVRRPGRDRGIVYQQYTLYPFLTARQNVAYGLTLDQTTLPDRILHPFKFRDLQRQHLEEADAILERYGLEQAIHLYPHEMSGGMRQRVSIAQAVIMRPEILFLDEPFGALDEATREELQTMLLELYQENIQAIKDGDPPPHTILIVTHELNEALYVADRILGLSQYWNWGEQGHGSKPGATIVYDVPCPIFSPGDVREYEHFVEQRQEIREVVFSEDNLQDPAQHRTFWDTVHRGEGDGIFAPSVQPTGAK